MINFVGSTDHRYKAFDEQKRMVGTIFYSEGNFVFIAAWLDRAFTEKELYTIYEKLNHLNNPQEPDPRD